VKILQYRAMELFTLDDFKIFDIMGFIEKAALDTFKPLAPLFQLHDARVLA